VAYQDVKISAQLMLWIETVSVCLIAFVVVATIWKHGLHADASQFRLRDMPATSIHMGVVLAIFSFVGFESAATLGEEAKEPLRTIPQAVIRSALLAGIFFIVCSYGEVLGFQGKQPGLGASPAPMRLLATEAGVGRVGPIIDLGVLVSMFAATLACVIAAARVLMLMAHHGLASRQFMKTHVKHETPARASLVTAALAFLPVAVLVERGVSGADVYGWMGSLAVFGFLTAYLLVALAMTVHLRQKGRLRVRSVALSVGATVAIFAVLLGTLFPAPPAPYRSFPYIYATFLACGMVWYFARSQARRRSQAGREELTF
jgi:amino acid transporter